MSTPQRIPYFEADTPLVPAWEFTQRWVPGKWTELGAEGSVFQGTWRHFAGVDGVFSPAYWRRHGDFVEFCGLVDKNGGNWAGGDPVVILPPEMRIPTSSRQWLDIAMVNGNAGATAEGVQVSYVVSTGTLAVSTLIAGITNPVYFLSLTGLRFPLI